MGIEAAEFDQLKVWVAQEDTDALAAWISEREKASSQALFDQIGTLTRGLYDSINHLQADTGNEQGNDMARDRLRFVVERTQDSANRVLDAVDESQPIAQKLLDESYQLSEKWQRLGNRELNAGEFRELYLEIQGFLQATVDNSNQLNQSLQSIVLAQDFQDLTGQVIERVIDMLSRVEHSLLDLISQSGGHQSETAKPAKSIEKKQLEDGIGPQTAATSDSVKSQDDVDDLLSSLGF